MASLAFGSKEDINLKFVDLNVSANEKDILKDVSGEIKAGEIFAIMGPSVIIFYSVMISDQIRYYLFFSEYMFYGCNKK